MGYSLYEDLKFNLSYKRLSEGCNLNTSKAEKLGKKNFKVICLELIEAKWVQEPYEKQGRCFVNNQRLNLLTLVNDTLARTELPASRCINPWS